MELEVLILGVIFILINFITIFYYVYQIYNILKNRRRNMPNNDYPIEYQLPNDNHRSIPPIIEFAGILNNEKNTIRYLIEKNILRLPPTCSLCNNIIKQDTIKPYMYRCIKKDNCGKNFSIKKYTFFGNTKLKANEVLQFIYYRLANCRYTRLKEITNYSTHTIITDFSSFLRELWDMTREENQGANYKIGGPGIIVQIDETKFGLRKYHVGHEVPGVWVLVELKLHKQEICLLLLYKIEVLQP